MVRCVRAALEASGTLGTRPMRLTIDAIFDNACSIAAVLQLDEMGNAPTF